MMGLPLLGIAVCSGFLRTRILILRRLPSPYSLYSPIRMKKFFLRWIGPIGSRNERHQNSDGGSCVKKIAIPIVWEILDKRGNSNTAERIKILNRIISYFGQERIAGVLADREFIGEEWFQYLDRLKNRFVIRIKANTLVPNARGEATLEASLPPSLRGTCP